MESNPDTTIKLINGDHILVREPMDQVVRLAIDYGRSLRKLLPPD
ncbi:MAG: flagellar FlbD family protein [Phycisphaeraceae bacterium]